MTENRKCLKTQRTYLGIFLNKKDTFLDYIFCSSYNYLQNEPNTISTSGHFKKF